MTIYALIKDGKKLREQDFDETPSKPNPKKGMKWVPIEKVGADLTFDKATEVKEFSETVMAIKVKKTWTIRAMTANELAAIVQRKLAATDEGMAQVAEDVAVAMITGKSLPQDAVDKINVRRRLRGETDVLLS